MTVTHCRTGIYGGEALRHDEAHELQGIIVETADPRSLHTTTRSTVVVHARASDRRAGRGTRGAERQGRSPQPVPERLDEIGHSWYRTGTERMGHRSLKVDESGLAISRMRLVDLPQFFTPRSTIGIVDGGSTFPLTRTF